MGNRSRTEIVGNILDAANGGTSKTKIMYIAFKLWTIKRILFYIDREFYSILTIKDNLKEISFYVLFLFFTLFMSLKYFLYFFFYYFLYLLFSSFYINSSRYNHLYT